METNTPPIPHTSNEVQDLPLVEDYDTEYVGDIPNQCYIYLFSVGINVDHLPNYMNGRIHLLSIVVQPIVWMPLFLFSCLNY